MFNWDNKKPLSIAEFLPLNNPCERQEQELIAYANRSGYEVIGIWKEIASGSKLGKT